MKKKVRKLLNYNEQTKNKNVLVTNANAMEFIHLNVHA